MNATAPKNRYLYYKSLSTNELENIIHLDFYSENNSLDTDELYAILQILEERKSDPKYDTQSLWKSFTDNYLSLAKRKISLYESSCHYKPLHSKKIPRFVNRTFYPIKRSQVNTNFRVGINKGRWHVDSC